MRIVTKAKVAVVPVAVAALLLVGALSLPDQPDGAADRGPALIDLQPGAISYRAAGDFTRGGKPAEAPIVAIRLERPLAIMRHQVTAGDYQRCVLAAACQPLAADVAVSDELPAVKVSWRDADAYAAWLSRGTGQHYRLPTDEEWAFAAGSRYRDDGVAVDANNPAKRWLARFEREAARQESTNDAEPRPIGSFGANEHGLLDLAGNVWEWTATCFVRVALDQADAAVAPAARTSYCGVRVVEGEHRAYVSDFIRDARAGGCAVGLPPSNLGFRLVREPGPRQRIPPMLALFERVRSALWSKIS